MGGAAPAKKDTSATETEVKNANLGTGVSSKWAALKQSTPGLELFYVWVLVKLLVLEGSRAFW